VLFARHGALLDRDDVARRRQLLFLMREKPSDGEREPMAEPRRKTAGRHVDEQREHESEREKPAVVARAVGGREHERS
jgi:hypothetical protein